MGGSEAPLMPTLYLTVAVPSEFTVTLDTVAFADDDRLDPAWLLMTWPNVWPFWSREIFVAADVLPLKKASQLAVIADTAPLPAVGSAAAEEGADDEGAIDEPEVAGADVDGEEPDPVVPLLELLQAVRAAVSASPAAATQV